MRGKHFNGRTEQILARITPADAGKTFIQIRCQGDKKDHPRGCGENFLFRKKYMCRKGSPPRMRGKLRYNLAKVIQIRITPADAGKTL